MLLCVGLFLAAPLAAQEPPSLVIYAPEAPPLASADPDMPRYLQQITQSGLTSCGINVVVDNTSWTRAQQLVRDSSDTAIIPLARTAMREADYQWIAELAIYQSAFVTAGAAVNSFADLTPDMLIGVETGTAHLDYLLSHGIDPEQIVEVRATPSLLELLLWGRIDVWFEGVPEIMHILNQRPQKVEVTISAPVHTLHLYLAAGLDFPPQSADRLAACIGNYKRSTAYADLITAMTLE